MGIKVLKLFHMYTSDVHTKFRCTYEIQMYIRNSDVLTKVQMYCSDVHMKVQMYIRKFRCTYESSDVLTKVQMYCSDVHTKFRCTYESSDEIQMYSSDLATYKSSDVHTKFKCIYEIQMNIYDLMLLSI